MPQKREERPKTESTYSRLIHYIFEKNYRPDMKEIPFRREDLSVAAEAANIQLPKNLGDVIYSMRYRTPLPESVSRTAPSGMEWVIEGKGKSNYAFRLVPMAWIVPNPHMAPIKIPDATPEMVAAHALSDEQALLAKVRYNRLIDVFLGVAAYSLQNHLRTTVRGLGQLEIDEIYVAIDKRGRQYVIPVQAKGGKDRLSSVQTRQDIACCADKFPDLICRAVSAQFVSDNLIALFELGLTGEEIRIIEERHYRLVPADEISSDDLRSYDR